MTPAAFQTTPGSTAYVAPMVTWGTTELVGWSEGAHSATVADPPWPAEAIPPSSLELGLQKALCVPDVAGEKRPQYTSEMLFHIRELGDDGFHTESSTVSTWESEPFSQPAYPEPEYDHTSVDHLLTDRMRQVLQGVLGILKRQAKLNYTLTTAVSVWGLANPEDRSNSVVVTQWVQLPSKHALKYWDRLAVAIHAWSETLPRALAIIVHERVVVEVRWKRHDVAV